MDTTGSKPKPVVIAAAIIVVAALIGVGIWYWFGRGIKLPPPGEVRAGGLGAQLYDKSQNPIVDKLPETNPFAERETNPFEETKTNPLKDVYKNPFAQ